MYGLTDSAGSTAGLALPPVRPGEGEKAEAIIPKIAPTTPPTAAETTSAIGAMNLLRSGRRESRTRKW